MSFEYHIAKRYLTQKKETGFITLITYISIIGLMIGVAALILTLGVLNGFERSIKDKIIEFQAHIRLETYTNQGFVGYEDILEQVQAHNEVAAVSPYVESECMLRKGRQADGVIVRGIDPDMIGDVINIVPFTKIGSFDLKPDADNTYGIVIGSDLYERFDLSIGDLIVLSSPPGRGAGMLGRPSIRQYRIAGVFETGMSDFDGLFAFIQIEEAQSYFKFEGKISGIDIRLHDIDQAKPVARMLSEDLGYPFFLRTWLDFNKTLFDWMEVQRLPILIAFGMIILVGSINLINTQVLVILEKQKDIGILKAIGANSRSIMFVFFILGIIVGLTATISGSLFAWLVAWIQNTYQVISLNKEVYFISELPIILDWKVFLQVGIVANLLCLAATLYPARKASKLMPAESVREA